MKFQKGSVRRSLKFSIIDGVFCSMMVGVTDAYLIPYVIALGATASQVAVLATAPGLVASLIQLKSASVTQSIGSRTKLINVIVFFHALLWIPILLLPYVLQAAHWTSVMIWSLALFVTLHASFGAFATPAWQSLMSDYIPTKKRGAYFGWRNRVQGIVVVACSVGAGLLLNYFGKDRIVGFTILFAFAVVTRLISWWCLTQMVEPFRKSSHDVYFSFWAFVSQLRTSNFAKFVFFISAMSCAVNISSPLLSLFLLKDIHFSYAEYMVVMTVASISGFLFQALWGRYADRYGNIRVLKIAGWGIAFLPCLWLFSRDLWYLVFVQAFAGASWGGFTLLYTNFMMEAVSPEKRIRCISYFNVVNGLAVFLGAAVGGRLIHYVPVVFGYSFLGLFLLSCIGRLMVMAFLSNQIREVRRV